MRIEDILYMYLPPAYQFPSWLPVSGRERFQICLQIKKINPYMIEHSRNKMPPCYNFDETCIYYISDPKITLLKIHRASTNTTERYISYYKSAFGTGVTPTLILTRTIA